MRRIVLRLLLIPAMLGLSLATAVPAQAHARFLDVTINRTLTEAPSGPFAGFSIVLSGAGTFSRTEPSKVHVSGTFFVRDASGDVVDHGAWRANSLVSFHSYGFIPGSPFLGGDAMFVVTFQDTMGHTDQVSDFDVQCLIGSPPPDAEEGVSIASIGFSEKIEGPHRFTLFEAI